MGHRPKVKGKIQLHFSKSVTLKMWKMLIVCIIAEVRGKKTFNFFAVAAFLLGSPQLGGAVSRGFLLSVAIKFATKRAKWHLLEDDRKTSLSRKWECGLDSLIRRPLPPRIYPLEDRCLESDCSYSALGLTFSWYSQACWASTVVVSILKTEVPS